MAERGGTRPLEAQKSGAAVLAKEKQRSGAQSVVSAGGVAWAAVVTASEHMQGCLTRVRDDVREE